jgi:hypothetical protein
VTVPSEDGVERSVDVVDVAGEAFSPCFSRSNILEKRLVTALMVAEADAGGLRLREAVGSVYPGGFDVELGI